MRVRVDVEAPPVSIPVRGPFHPGAIWTMKGSNVVVFEPEPDPFPSPRPVLLLVTNDDTLYRRIEQSTPRNVMLLRATTLSEAKSLIAERDPARIVCSELLALGHGSILEWLEQEHPHHLATFEIVCASSGSDWLAKYLEARALRRMEILEEPLEDDAIGELMQRARRPPSR